MTGILAIKIAGSKNQKIPTPKVNRPGRTKHSKVAFISKPSHRPQEKPKMVTSVKPPIAQKRYSFSKKLIPKNPKERRREIIINFTLFVIYELRTVSKISALVNTL